MSRTRVSRAAAAAALAALTGCLPGGSPRAIVESGGREHAVVVEVAADPASLERGLSLRRRLAEGHGMLFVFPEEEEHSFWMKDTLVPLDMVFVSGDGRVTGVVHRAQPLSLEPHRGGRCRFVLEVPGGWAEARGVKVGDRVRLEGVPLRRFE